MSVILPLLDESTQRPVYANGPRSLSAVRLLRISVTDRCNLRCVYCMPEHGVKFAPKDALLTRDQIVAVARAATSIGVDHLKVTGGEPTVRPDLLPIIEGLAELPHADLSMTTNGLLLNRLAVDLRRAGLDRLTLSLDSMQPDRFARIGRGAAGDGHAQLATFWKGIDAAVGAGFEKLKFNTVVVGGINDDEVVDFARLTLTHPWTVRFIEYMPLGDSTLVDESDLYTVDNAEVRRRIEAALGPLTPVARQTESGVGPAQVFTLAGARGRVGFISAMSKPFCETCNRLRLTATGELRACLFDGGEVDVRPALEPEPDSDAILALMGRCVQLKPEVHSHRGNRAMSQMGG